VQPDKLSLTLDGSGTQTEPVSVWVRNSAAVTVTPIFVAVLEDKHGKPADSPRVDAPSGTTVQAISAGDVGRSRLVISGITKGSSLSGELVAKPNAITPNVAPATLAVTIAPKPNYDHRSDYILIFAGVFALIVVGLTGWFSEAKLKGTLSPANLDFSGAFASRITVVTALLGTIVAASVLPSHTKWLSADSYKALNIIFGALIACAALSFGAVQKQVNGASGPELHGYGALFLVSAFITVWAVYGVLATLWFMIWDINQTSGFTEAGVLVFHGILIFAAAAMLVYVVIRIFQITDAAANESPPARGSAAAPRAGRAGGAVTVGRVRPSSLL
jgi:hypothetical protein